MTLKLRRKQAVKPKHAARAPTHLVETKSRAAGPDHPALIHVKAAQQAAKDFNWSGVHEQLAVAAKHLGAK
jgi:hypothetical protein